ncbi:MAG: hypothetical protein JNJ70_02400 [Verrucomicrobiales bacterium]|nr:hypothetical protein [Verrucomicrobiales bacterium]
MSTQVRSFLPLSDEFQLHIDFRTGKPTVIIGPDVNDGIRAACHATNLGRKSGIEAAFRSAPPRRTVSIDVWTDRFTDGLTAQKIPLIDLESFGFRHEDGFLTTSFLCPLPSGAEASPFLDTENGVVYKLFDLRPGGAMGKKLRFQTRSQGFEIESTDARWSDMVDKFIVLNRGGGHPTELAGISADGGYLIAKQPQAFPFEDFRSDLAAAEAAMCGIVPIGGGLRQHLFVTEIDGIPWLVGDLHERNIMRDMNGQPTIIDALVGEVSLTARRELDWLDAACGEARVFRETGTRPPRWDEAVDDGEL